MYYHLYTFYYSDKNYLEDSENEEKMAVPSVKAPKSKKDRKKKKEEELEEAQRELERINQGELSDEVDTANKLNADILKTNKTSDSLSKMDVDEPHTEKIKSKSKKKDKKVIFGGVRLSTNTLLPDYYSSIVYSVSLTLQ